MISAQHHAADTVRAKMTLLEDEWTKLQSQTELKQRRLNEALELHLAQQGIVWHRL